MINLLNKLNYQISILWDITYNCNINCKHCCVDPGKKNSSTRELSRLEIKKMFTNILNSNLKIFEFNFQGGEPLVAKNFLYAIELIGSLKIPWTVNTNGTCWDDTHIDIIKKFPPDAITFSLDGSSSVMHDWLRGEGVFNILIRNIEKINKNRKHYSNCSLNTICVLTKKNINHFKEIIDLASSMGIDEIIFPLLSISGNAIKNKEELEPNSEDLFEFLKFVFINRGRYKNSRIYVPWVTPKMVDTFNKIFKVNIPNGYAGCQAIRGQVLITPDGYLKPCPNSIERILTLCNDKELLNWSEDSSLVKQTINSIRTNKCFTKVYNLLHNNNSLYKHLNCKKCGYNSICSSCPSHRFINEDPNAELCAEFHAKYLN